MEWAGVDYFMDLFVFSFVRLEKQGGLFRDQMTRHGGGEKFEQRDLNYVSGCVYVICQIPTVPFQMSDSNQSTCSGTVLGK